MTINVLAAFSNLLFSEGIVRLIGCEDGLTATAVAPGKEPPTETVASASVILADLAALRSPLSWLHDVKRPGVILVDSGYGREDLVSAIISGNIGGVLLHEAGSAILKKAVRSVASGEVWIDRSVARDLVNGINALKRSGSQLSGKEREIAALTGKGLRNREIAERLGISEVTVKTHLQKIYKKLNIRTRARLIAFLVNDAAVQKMLPPVTPGRI